jgi:hypothetical protein
MNDRDYKNLNRSVENLFKLCCFEYQAAMDSQTGLPDGLFSNQKSKFGRILEGLWRENVDAYFKAYWNILRTFGIFYDL